MYQPYDPATANVTDRIAWALCQIIDDDAPLRWTRYRGAAGCIASNKDVMRDLIGLAGNAPPKNVSDVVRARAWMLEKLRFTTTHEDREHMSAIEEAIAAYDPDCVVARTAARTDAPITYGLRRKGTTAIVGVIPAKIHERKPTAEWFAENYEEVPLFSGPPADVVQKAARYQWIRDNVLWSVGWDPGTIIWTVVIPMSEPDISKEKLTDDSVRIELDNAVDAVLAAASEAHSSATRKGCGATLAKEEWHRICGEIQQGDDLGLHPVLCTECGGQHQRADSAGATS